MNEFIIKKYSNFKLLFDSCTQQLQVIAYDNAYPSNRATSEVAINVQRNVNGPVFTPTSTYEKTVSENVPIGTSLLTVSAEDRDFGVR